MLSLFAAIINKLGRKMEKEVPRIFEAVFQVTLDMITKNFEVGFESAGHTLSGIFELGAPYTSVTCRSVGQSKLCFMYKHSVQAEAMS